MTLTTEFINRHPIVLQYIEELNQRIDFLENELTRFRPSKAITLNAQDEAFRYELSSIIRCEAFGNYSKVFLSNGKMHCFAKTLKSIEAKIDSENFIRVHQSHLINTAFVEKYVLNSNSFLILKNGIQIPISRSKKKSFKNDMSKIYN